MPHNTEILKGTYSSLRTYAKCLTNALLISTHSFLKKHLYSSDSRGGMFHLKISGLTSQISPIHPLRNTWTLLSLRVDQFKILMFSMTTHDC